MSEGPNRTVVIEMTDEVYQALARAAESGGVPLGELLIGHAIATELNVYARSGDMRSWRRLFQAWRRMFPGSVPAIDITELFGD